MSAIQAGAELALDRKFFVAGAHSDYPSLGARYRRPGYEMHCSPTLVRTGGNFYCAVDRFLEMLARKELPSDARLSAPADILAIGRRSENPREIPEFRDYFGSSVNYCREFTQAFLRVPKGWKNGKVDTRTGRYPREVGFLDVEALKSMPLPLDWKEIGDSANRIVGVISVPYSDWFVVRKMDEVFSIPVDVEQTAGRAAPYALHFKFDPEPEVDRISGRYDVAVVCGSGWYRDGKCLNVVASGGRQLALSDVGFRPVRGSFEIVSESVSRF